MTRWFMAIHDETGTKSGALAAADDQESPGGDWEGWTLVELAREPGAFDRFEDGGLVLDSMAIDAALQGQVDTEAGAFRCRFITNVPGQELIYLRKEGEARDLLAGGIGPWPVLTAQAAATGQDIEELAADVVGRADAWIVLGARIEAARMAAKRAIVAAQSEADKRAAAVVDWESLVDPGEQPEPMSSPGREE